MAGSSLVPGMRRAATAPASHLEPPDVPLNPATYDTGGARWTLPPELRAALAAPSSVFPSSYQEWTAEQLRDAALHVLKVQAAALRCGATLANVPAHAVQFRGSRPVWIDATAFTSYAGGPWPAYADFSRVFLAPLLMAAHGQRAAGEPPNLREASRRLPLSSWLLPGALRHVHLPARLGLRVGGIGTAGQAITSLWQAVERLDVRPRWAPWTACDGAREDGLLRILLKEAVRMHRPNLVYLFGDGGGNCARTIAAEGIDCVSYDADPARVAACYLHERAAGGSRLLPLVGSLAGARRLAHGAPRGGLAVVLSRGLEPLLPLGLLPEEIARLLLRLGERVLLEFDPAAARAGLVSLLAAFRPWFRPAEVAEISTTGRCLCSLIPA